MDQTSVSMGVCCESLLLRTSSVSVELFNSSIGLSIKYLLSKLSSNRTALVLEALICGPIDGRAPVDISLLTGCMGGNGMGLVGVGDLLTLPINFWLPIAAAEDVPELGVLPITAVEPVLSWQ